MISPSAILFLFLDSGLGCGNDDDLGGLFMGEETLPLRKREREGFFLSEKGSLNVRKLRGSLFIFWTGRCEFGRSGGRNSIRAVPIKY